MIGVDGSAKMLALARAKLPGVDFRPGDLHALPIADHEVDLVTISLALTHVPDLAPVLDEFARVLRPGGHLVIADSRMDYPMVLAMPDGSYGYMPHHSWRTSEYLTAALPLGFDVRHCEELRRRQLGIACPEGARWIRSFQRGLRQAAISKARMPQPDRCLPFSQRSARYAARSFRCPC